MLKAFFNKPAAVKPQKKPEFAIIATDIGLLILRILDSQKDSHALLLANKHWNRCVKLDFQLVINSIYQKHGQKLSSIEIITNQQIELTYLISNKEIIQKYITDARLFKIFRDLERLAPFNYGWVALRRDRILDSLNLILIENNVKPEVMPCDSTFITRIPKTIFDDSFLGSAIKKIRHLSLVGNKIKHLTKEIVQLTNLEFLDISNCELTELPYNLGELKRLESLAMNNNQIESLPASMRNLAKLNSFAARNNLLTDITSLKDLPLKKLDVQKNLLHKIPKRLHTVLYDSKKKVSLTCKQILDMQNKEEVEDLTQNLQSLNLKG